LQDGGLRHGMNIEQAGQKPPPVSENEMKKE
jgi:hypothetical protein